MRGVPNEALRAEVIRLRVEERLSLREIQGRTGASKGSLSTWLRAHPLSKEESNTKARVALARPRPGARKSRGEESVYYRMVHGRSLSRLEKGQIAEAAVLFRLTLHGLHVLAPVFDGGRTDWLVETQGGSFVKLQVKWASTKDEHGLPSMKLTCAEGHSKRRRYREHEFDFLVGYDLFTDTAYIFSWAEAASNKSAISVREDAAERWDKITGT